MRVGERFSLDSETVAAMVLRTGEAARMDSHDNARGAGAAYIRQLGVCCAVGAPIVVDGRLWGAAIVGSTQPGPLPPDSEARVGDFADLVGTAIANAETRAQLTASRARIVAAADDARRRFERDLHDGAQQRLVSLGLELRAAEASVPTELHPLKDQIAHIATDLGAVSQELREISHGLHPAILSRGLARRSRRWAAAPPFRWSSTSVSMCRCPNVSKWRLTTLWRKRLRMRPNTHTHLRSMCA